MSYTNLEKYKQWLRENLSEERYEHSLGTAEKAYELAEKFGEDKDKAYLCGLIHDCAKCKQDVVPIEKIEKDSERDYYMTSEEAKEYGLIDDILSKAN